MTEHRFTLILAGNVDEHLDDLFEAGCDDATVGSVDGVHFAEFDREASSLTEALASAISAVESVPTLRVKRIEPDDLVTASDIADRLDRSRESVRLLVAGQRGPGGFPSPVSHLRARNRLWRWSEVAAWAGAAGSPPADDARIIAALNAALELRAASPLLLDDTRSLVRSLESSAA
ncbi:MAG: hypothetical protein JF887_14135 [Candidatus Dormibacteraeota bacterium]|uniref:DNA-binding protein n=1 Tax=Candidatus Amunia macphersoniae TaxID=3127014 RepID=A0A934KSY0_9BACT|nr:hypothetical protein [Candidatus Dormibacteraeota bacterium]